MFVLFLALCVEFGLMTPNDIPPESEKDDPENGEENTEYP
jgi:hypothetical protein